jgi:hypothetical protein
MSLSFSSLKSNLQEIYAAAHSTQPSLIANVQGTRIYVSTKGIGRLWTCFYKFVGIFKPNAVTSAKERILKKALDKTHAKFQQKLHSVEPYLKEYQEYLHSACHGYIFTGDVKKVNQSRWKITNWNDATLPFLKLLHQQKNVKLLQFFQKYFPPAPNQPTPSIFSPELLTQCSQEQSVIDLEAILQSSMPFDAFGRIWRGQHQDEAQLKRCIRVIRQRQDEIPSNLFHEALKSMIELDALQNPKEIQSKLAHLEVMLIDEGCKNIFIKDDEQHLAWRDALKQGDRITCNGKTITLGQQIGMPRLHDKTVLFEVQGDPESLVMIKVNRALHGIKNELQNKLNDSSNGTYKIIPYKEIDTNGSCALVPRLYMTLDNITWKTTPNANEVFKADKAKFNSLCELIKNMRKNQITPQSFSSTALMFDRQERLWFFKAPQEGPFDFNAIQDFVLKVSNNNLTIFQQLMHASGMDSHPIAQVYQQVVEEALKDTNHENIVNIVQRSNIDDTYNFSTPKILKDPIQYRAQQLYNEVVAMKQRCSEDLQRTRGVTPAAAAKTTSKDLLKAYKNTKAAGILWPTLRTLAQL